jgi:SPP1 family predicted phage head-tail adaptor
MLIGRMDKRIKLQAYVKVSGVSAWTTQGTVWAEFKKPELKTAELAGNLASELTREIGIRYRADVRKGWRVLWGTRTFDVMHTYDYGKSTTMLVCKEVVI